MTIQKQIESLRSAEIDSLLIFQNIKTFLSLIREDLEAKGNTNHKYYKIVLKLEIDCRAVEHYQTELNRKVAYYAKSLEGINTM